MSATVVGLGDIVLRTVVSLLAAGLVGLNRRLHHQGAGLRTFGLVALGTTGMTLMVVQSATDPGDLSRVVQGLLAGVGFLGGGVIMRRSDVGRVTGLTSAAAVWFVAALSVLCGLGLWVQTTVMLVVAFLLLVFGRNVERWFERVFGRDGEDDEVQ